MKITLVNNTIWKQVFVKLLNKERVEIEKYKVNFNDNIACLDIDLDKAFYLYLNNGRTKSTEIIYLSENINTIELKYNHIRKETDAYFVNNNCSYNEVINYTLKDDKNLFYREDKSKNIHVLLPSNYDEAKSYGLLLMFDGQNIYDKNNVGNYTLLNDPYGSWQIDVSLSNIKNHFNEEYIIVGLENADFYRMNELMMNKEFGEVRSKDVLEGYPLVGYLDNLDDFINETLLPFIFSKYNVDQNKIGIGGSSCGGVACHYVGLKNLGKYKFILCYTPASALYFDESWSKFYEKLDFKANYSKLPIFYYFQGQKDDLEKMLSKFNEHLVSNLLDKGYNKDLVMSLIEPTAYHNETAWRFAFNYMIYKTHELLKKQE